MDVSLKILKTYKPAVLYRWLNPEGRLEVNATMEASPSGGFVPYDDALRRIQECNALEARIKELEGVEAKLIETSGACFRVARRYQLESGEHPPHLADWLEGRLKRLAEQEAESEKLARKGLVPVAYWKDRARTAEAQLAGRTPVQFESPKPGDAAGLFARSYSESALYEAQRKPPISLIPQRLDAAERALSNLEEITSQLLTDGDGVDVRLEALEDDSIQRLRNARVDRVDRDLEDLKRRIKPWSAEVDRRIAALETNKTDLSLLVTGLLDRLGALEHRAPSTEERMATLEQEVANDKEARIAMGHRVDALEREEGTARGIHERRLAALEAQSKHQP